MHKLRLAYVWAALAVIVGFAAVATVGRTDIGAIDGTNPAASRFFVAGLDSLATALERMRHALRGDRQTAVASFRAARQAYKRVELFITYFNPLAAANINGPRVDEDDDIPPPKSVPIGFQVVESAVFDDETGFDSASAEVARMQRMVSGVTTLARRHTVSPATAVDAARLQLARIATLGFAGFDSDASGDAIIESAAAIEGTRDVLLAVLQDTALRRQVNGSLTRAASELRTHPNFATFERISFISSYLMPAARAIASARRETGNAPPNIKRLWNESAPTPFDAGAFSPDAFAPAHARSGGALATIGARMFFDTQLSGPRTRSCASCHDPAKAFADGLPRAADFDGGTAVLRNTPTLINAALQPGLFADGSATSLENQIGVVLESASEMASSVDTVAARLERDLSYQREFRLAIPDRGDSAITGLEVRQALAAYLRTLNATGSRFDRAIRGDTSALTPQERTGFNVFMGRAKCGTCHFAPLFSGLTPPAFTNSEAEIIGTPATNDLARPRLDPDIGRAKVEDTPLNRFAFRVPTLRNIAETAPYMHNGVFATLEQVVEFYDRGGGAGIGLTLPYQSLPATPLRLTTEEKQSLVAFMKTLTDLSVQSHSANPIRHNIGTERVK
jgi:cytochrome c peroxidase